MDPKKAAILIDCENLFFGMDYHADLKNSFTVRTILNHVTQTIGAVATVRKAYADWSNPKLRKMALDMVFNGVEMQHTIRAGYNNGKNIDTGLGCTCGMAALLADPEVGLFIIASGDSSFLPLVNYLKSTGRTVIGIGIEGTVANILVRNCDQYLYLTPNGLQAAICSGVDKNTVLRTIRNILTNGSMNVDDLDDELADALPEFAPEDFGFETLEAYLASYPNQFRLDTAEDGTQVVTWTPPVNPRQSRYAGKTDANGNDLRNAPFEEYMKATRWYIPDGPTRETVLNNIYNCLSQDEARVLSNEALRAATTQECPLEDKPWQGTIYSLVCGGCLWERPESNDVPPTMRSVALNKNILSLQDFLVGYYVSLFHKAFNERQDLTPRLMSELLHPEAIESHLPLFEQVYESLQSRSTHR